MARMTRERCGVCGASWTQQWLEPIECPNGCDGQKEDDAMNDRATPETCIVIHGVCFTAHSKFAELVGLCQRLEQERDDLKDALRVRMRCDNRCPECPNMLDWAGHAKTCRHAETERKVTEAKS